MVFIVIGDSDSKKNTASGISVLQKAIQENKHVFLMIFSNGCPPCEASKPIWDRLKSSFAHNKDAVVARIVSSDFSKLQNAGSEPNGVPTFRYLHDKKVEEFSEGRIFDVFTKWIHSKCKTKKGGRTVKRAKRGGGNDSKVISTIVQLTNDFMEVSLYGTSIPDVDSETKKTLVLNLEGISKTAMKLLESSLFNINKVRFTKEQKEELVRLYSTFPDSCKPGAQEGLEWHDATGCHIIDIYNAYAAIFEIVGPVYLGISEEKGALNKSAYPKLSYELSITFQKTYNNLNSRNFRFQKEEYSPQQVSVLQPPSLFQNDEYSPQQVSELPSPSHSPSPSEFIDKVKVGGRRRKWSLKYKRSINCKKPRGFSQKQYCRKKTRKRL